MTDLVQYILIVFLALAVAWDIRGNIIVLDALAKWMAKQEEINREMADWMTEQEAKHG